jgi:predicted TIM-barrel fold metal-dependent hydrolase
MEPSSKIWANSGDSHLVEPADLFTRSLPPDVAERMPRSVKDAEGGWETIHVDGQEFRRRLPRAELRDEDGKTVDERAPGANDPTLRLKDLDQEGVWAELVYPSIGIWASSINDPVLLREGTVAINDWSIEFQKISPRYVCTSSLPLLVVQDAVAEVERAAGLGFKAAFFPVSPSSEVGDWHMPGWEPLWSAMEETGTVVSFHIGTEPHDASTSNGLYYRGPGGALLNYMETTYGGQRAASKLIASGVFDRHPDLRIIVSEGGATWGPFVADRLDEAYRQHSAAVRPQLSKLPSEYLYTNVYASFQHDRSAVQAHLAMGWKNILWGSDYPHLEGTYGHTQKTLQELFGDVADEPRRRMTVGAFEELFPHVPPAPAG